MQILGLKNKRSKVVLGNKTNLISTLGKKTIPLSESYKQAEIQRMPVSTVINNTNNSSLFYKEPLGLHKNINIKKNSFQIEKKKKNKHSSKYE